MIQLTDSNKIKIDKRSRYPSQQQSDYNDRPEVNMKGKMIDAKKLTYINS